MKKRLLALTLVAALFIGLLAGCGNNANKPSDTNTPSDTNQPADTDKTNEPSKDAKGEVYYLNFKPEQNDAWQALAKAYTEETGVPVTVVTAASGTYEETLMSEIAKSNPPTLFQVNGPVGLANWKDYCLDLNGSAILGELTSEDFALKDGDAVLGIAYVIESYGLITNKTLLQQAGYSVDDIKSFADLKKVAEDITARKDELGFAAFSSTGMDGSSDWRFKTHLANLEYYYEQEGTPWTECPATISGKYMDNFKALYDLCINNSLTAPSELATGGHDAAQEFKDGKAAFHVQGSWEYASYKETVPNATMIPYYCGVEGEEKAGLNCGTENCWAINANVSEADQKATMDFMVWLVSDSDASAKMVEQLGIMPYKNAAESTNGFLADAAEYTANGCYVMNWATNYQPNVDAYRATLVAALNQYNADQSDANWETVRTAFVDGWATQYQAVNG